LALDLGGQAQIWRSSADADPSRIVRGVIFNQSPGQESTSLLISPEGWLIGLMAIEDAEQGKLSEPPWCFVKTQFGPLEGHVALVEVFAALKREFIPDLEVRDEGGYWETRDFDRLRRKFATLQAAIEGLAAGLRAHGLSREAAEDPDILIQRITRIAEKVRQSLGRPAEHAPPSFPDEVGDFEEATDAAEREAAWDELYKDSRRRQERFHRLVEERLARGEDYEQAMEGAMKDAGISDPAVDMSDGDDDSEFSTDEFDWSDDGSDFDAEEFAVGPEAGDPSATSELLAAEDDESAGADSDPDPFDRDRHPLLERASEFWMRLHELFKDGLPGERAAPKKSSAESALHTLFQGAGDLCGGLAQALTDPEDYPDRGLCVVQLKRALRGLAFMRGALCNISMSGTEAKAMIKELHATVDQLESDTFQELGQAREAI
jgi:hypothetical protein